MSGRMTDPADDDLPLLQAWRSGDAQAGTTLVRRYEPTLRRFFEHRVGDRWIDAIQEVWLAVGRNIATLELHARFRWYLLAVANNKAREFRRQYARERKQSPIDEQMLADPFPSPEHMLDGNVLATRLNRTLAAMPANTSEVIQLYYVDGLSARRVGARLGVPENTARSRVRRATKSLRQALAGAPTLHR
jgi:RNA polymerase sigma-70 factor (ECF subfamily)